ncbi:putative uncharacterized protein C6orf52 homolog [Meriones unguiculatus]|uniref:putative uncharacterized protein C6orf52 homolog n=1 Tax=Meriones unguiculatus TaxID=10047 RepID=UPI000B4F97AA|nr:putative uncharacterized protein C6orf52 homolog [Meriones unguiculatus]
MVGLAGTTASRAPLLDREPGPARPCPERRPGHPAPQSLSDPSANQNHPYLKLLEKSECVVLPQWVTIVTPCPLPSVIREWLRFHCSHCDNHYEQLHIFCRLSCFSYGSTVNGNGPSPLCVYENAEALAGAWAIPEVGRKYKSWNKSVFSVFHTPDLLDPNLHLNTEESNKEFVAESEEMDDSLASSIGNWKLF